MKKQRSLRSAGSRRIVGPLLAAIAFAGCHFTSRPIKPSIEVTKVPVASIGGPDQMDEISGRVRNASPGQQVILYARSGVWWIQPFANQPFTRIESDSTWKSFTHLGTEYAVLLVDRDYRPAAKAVSLPPEGAGVVAIAIVHGKAGVPANAKIVHFSGYDWTVRSSESDHGGEPNAYDPDNAWIDDHGYLHLRMRQQNGHWTCAEVSLNQTLGYGTYRFVIHDSAHLSPSGVVGFFTWDETRSEGLHNEFDIELSRWGDAKARNAQYVVQPFYVPENFYRFSAPPGVSSYQVRWNPGSLSFATFAGVSPGPDSNPVSEHQFSSGVPIPASEKVHMDLYDFHHAEYPSQPPGEVIIEKFEYSR